MISLKELSIGYTDKVVKSGISAEMADKGILYILGENGAGKTTLINTLLGVNAALSGEIKISGKICYVPQKKAVNCNFPISAYEVICSNNKFNLSTDIVNKLQIEDLLKQQYRRLSGGQQERILIARAMNTNPDILMLDEPTTGLDAESVKSIRDIITELKGKIAIIVVTHDKDIIVEGEDIQILSL